MYTPDAALITMVRKPTGVALTWGLYDGNF